MARGDHLALKPDLLGVCAACAPRLLQQPACELVLEVIQPENGHFGEEELA